LARRNYSKVRRESYVDIRILFPISITVEEPIVFDGHQEQPVREVSNPGAHPFTVTEMSDLKLQNVFFMRYNYQLMCDASWKVNTGLSSSQDRSRITKSISIMLQFCDHEDKAILETPKPNPNSPEYELWRSELSRISSKVENKVQDHLEQEEKIYLPARKSEKRTRKMLINAVMDRFRAVEKAKKTKIEAAAPSITSHFATVQGSSSASASSSSTASTEKATAVPEIIKKKDKKKKNYNQQTQNTIFPKK
jgi:hypothetical protein